MLTVIGTISEIKEFCFKARDRFTLLPDHQGLLTTKYRSMLIMARLPKVAVIHKVSNTASNSLFSEQRSTLVYPAVSLTIKITAQGKLAKLTDCPAVSMKDAELFPNHSSENKVIAQKQEKGYQYAKRDNN